MFRVWFIISLMTSTFSFISAGDNWELAAAVSNKIDLIDKDGYIIDYFPVPDDQVTHLAYDFKHKELYFAVVNNSLHSIFQLNPFDHSAGYIPVVTKAENAGIVNSIAIDTMTRTLYWAIGNKIKYLLWDDNNKPTSGTDFLEFDSVYTPIDLAIDVCDRTLYWTMQHNDNTQSLVQKIKLGVNNKVIQLVQVPHSAYGIVIDHSTNHVYWTEEGEGSHMFIKSLPLYENVTGTPKIDIGVSNGHRPSSLTRVDSQFFWTDKISNNFYTSEFHNGRTKVFSLSMHEKEKSSSKVYDIISVKENSFVNPDDCHRSSVTTEKQVVEKSSDCVAPEVGEKYFVERNGKPVLACNDKKETKDAESNCNQKSSDVPNQEICNNYCLNDGHCIVTDKVPVCKCKLEWGGRRCEKSECDNYCFNNGICYFKDGKKNCNCSNGFDGPRCEKHVKLQKFVCVAHCTLIQAGFSNDILAETLSSQDLPVVDTDSSCQCKDLNINKNPRLIPSIEDNISNNFSNKTSEIFVSTSVMKNSSERECLMDTWIFAALCGLSLMCLLLFTVTAVLISKVMSLKKRPRIKKRIIVNKNVTPLTSRPQDAEHCEITIENCCNMNICETPCFEPDLRRPRNSEKSKKEEKKSLLTAIDLPPDDLY